MSIVLNKAALARSVAAQGQAAQIQELRRVAMNMNRHLQSMTTNALPDLSPRAWLDLDTQTVQLIGQEADPLFTDLMALSRSVNIGKLVAAYRRLGSIDAGETSLTGQIPKLMGDAVADYDGVVIPIHTKGFGKQWRELEGLREIGADDIAELQGASVREVQRLMTVNFTDGNPLINYQGASSYGIKNNPNTIGFVFTVDMTSPTATYAEIQGQIVAFLNSIRGGDNRVVANVTLYQSPEIEVNLQRTSGQGSTQDRTFRAALLADTAGVDDIKTSFTLTGNQMFAIVRNAAYIQPVTGMAITTTPIPRQVPFADYQWLTWSASGLLIKADQAGRSGVAYGASA